MANVDKLVQYAELKVGQFGTDYREHHEHDAVAEIKPRAIRAEGTHVIVAYDAREYTIDLTKSGVKGEVTTDDAKLVADRMTEYYQYN